MNRISCLCLLAAAFLISGSGSVAAQDPLPSWHDTNAKQRIVSFVGRVTDKASPDFVPAEARIATFDNDGTLWSEKPIYFQVLFALDRIKTLAPQHPEWRSTQPFKAVLEDDHEAFLASGKEGLLKILAATHAGMTEAEFRVIVEEWLSSARHPRFKQAYNKMTFKPMLEVLRYLRSNGFKTFIVSGGGVSFMRPWAPGAYGIPPEQIIGSSLKTRFEFRDGKPVIMRLPEVFFFDDKAEKPVAINKFIGRRPIAAFGNSDGDLQMLQWTAGGSGPSLKVIIHHTDGEREWAYDRDSHIGRLDKALDEASKHNWTVVDMKRDWRVVYAFEE